MNDPATWLRCFRALHPRVVIDDAELDGLVSHALRETAQRTLWLTMKGVEDPVAFLVKALRGSIKPAVDEIARKRWAHWKTLPEEIRRDHCNCVGEPEEVGVAMYPDSVSSASRDHAERLRETECECYHPEVEHENGCRRCDCTTYRKRVPMTQEECKAAFEDAKARWHTSRRRCDG